MPVRIRLSRVGRKNVPLYRVVAAHKEKPRDGRFLEVLGTYNPKHKDKKLNIDKDRLQYWIQKGATLTPVIRTMLNKQAL